MHNKHHDDELKVMIEWEKRRRISEKSASSQEPTAIIDGMKISTTVETTSNYVLRCLSENLRLRLRFSFQ